MTELEQVKQELRREKAMRNAAEAYLKDLLWELPAEFGGEVPELDKCRSEFRVIKRRNVRKVHRALWGLQQMLKDHNHDIS